MSIAKAGADNVLPITLGAAAAMRGEPIESNPYFRQVANTMGWAGLKPDEALRRWHVVERSLDQADLGAVLRLRFRNYIEWHAGYRQAKDAKAKIRPGEPRIEIEHDAKRGIPTAKYSDDQGTPEMRKQMEVIESEVREDGESRKRPRTVDLVRSLRKSGYLDFKEEMACRQFHRDFHLSRLDPMRISDPGRLPGGGGREDLSPAQEDAKRRVNRCIEVMGGIGTPIGSVTWHILGECQDIKKFAEEAMLGRGRAVRPDIVRGLVISAAGILVTIYQKDTQKDGSI